MSEQKKPDMRQMMELATRLLKGQYASLEASSTQALPPEEILLQMADGVSLRTVIRQPAGNGPFPTIVQRSCYPHLECMHQAHAAAYAERGFAYVYQFCRGVGGSGGIWEPNVNDREDGKHTLDWLDALPWVKSIGYYGSSYLAFTGWVVADIVPPKVRTLYLTHYGTDRFVSAYQRGLFRQDVLTAWAMENAGMPVSADFIESAAFRPQIEVDTALWGTGELSWYRAWITNTNRDDPYWTDGFWKMLKDIPGKIRVPVYLGASWYDHHLGSALQTWKDLSPESRARSTMRIGAWNHMFMPCVDGQRMENLDNSDTKTAFEWFRAHLREAPPSESKVLAYQIGADEWSEQPAYPFKPDSICRMYLSAQPNGDGGYTLSKSDAKDGRIEYQYDPDHPVPTHGAESVLRHIDEAGSRLQPACGYRDDVISFVSGAIESPIEILGRIAVTLYVSSDAEDTAFTAKVIEVFPDGSAYSIRGSIATLAYPEESTARRLPYTPDTIVPVTIEMWDILWKTRAGSRLRIDISSSSFPEYAAHTNSPGIWALQKNAKIAHQALHFGIKHPACAYIPLAQAVNRRTT